MLYDPAFPLLGMYLDKTIIQEDTCTPVFTAAPFKLAMTWRQPKCPLTEEWIELWCRYTIECYSAIRKRTKKMSFAATWMDLEITILNEMSDKKRRVLYSITYMWNLKKKSYKWTYLWNRNRLTDIESKLVTKGVSREGINLEFRINRHTLLYIK